MYRIIIIFGFYVAKRYRLTIFVRVLDTVIFFRKIELKFNMYTKEYGE
jgi:hypothetical protein